MYMVANGSFRAGPLRMGSKKNGQREKWTVEKRAVIQNGQKKNGHWEKWAVKFDFQKKTIVMSEEGNGVQLVVFF